MTIHTAAFFTLGCKLNFAETSAIGRLLADHGIVRWTDEEPTLHNQPDLCVINTCSVTEMADKKGRQLIRRIHSRFPDATIVVTGCYAQLKPDDVASLPGVDIVLGSNEKLLIAEWLDRWLEKREQQVATTRTADIRTFRPSCERGDRTRWFLKVQDGCDYYCTYCTIPYARGRSRSGRTADLVVQAREVAAAGGKEIVLTGVNIGEFGRDTGESFLDLLKRLDEVEGIERYRISSIEPNLLTPEIIRWTAREARAFMPHFHIPLQSGSDRVLKLMNRRYDTALFRDRVDMVTDELPDAFIGIDVIAGARGETEEEWLRSRDFIASLPFGHLHVFPYSERPGTAALALGDPVSQEEKHRRVAELTRLSDVRGRDFAARFVGTVRPVLWEHPDATGRLTGFTDNYLRVVMGSGGWGQPPLHNAISRVRLTGIDPADPTLLLAEIENFKF